MGNHERQSGLPATTTSRPGYAGQTPNRLAKPRLLRRFLAPALVACIGIAAGLVLFNMVHSWELRQATREFQGDAKERVAVFESHMQRHVRALDALRAFFLSSEQVEPREFASFADVLLMSEPERQGLGWIDRVPSGQRQAHEQARRDEGLTDFEIRRWGKDGHAVTPETQEYFPIHFIQPRPGQFFLGLDLSSNPACRAAMELARDTGAMIATAPFHLSEEKSDLHNMIIFLPVYAKGAPTTSTAERRENLVGFVFEKYVTEDILAHAFERLTPEGVDVLVLDASAILGDQFLGVHRSRWGGPPAQDHPPTPTSWRDDRLGQATTLEIAGRSFLVLCKPAEGFIAAKMTWIPWLGMLSAWGLTLLLVAYLQSIRAGRSRTEMLAMELADANESLLMEMQERESANEDLRASEQQFKTLVANIPGVTYRCACDKHWTMEFISDEIEHLVGYPAGDFIANAVRSYASIIHPDDTKMVEGIILEGVGNRRPYSIEYRVVHADRSIRWVYERGQGIFDDNQVQWLDGVIVDVTERKLAEQALQESERRYRAIFDGASEGILIADAETAKFLYANPTICTMLGYSQQELPGMGVTDIHPADQLDMVMPYFQAQASGEIDHAPSLPVLRKDGEVIYADISSATLTLDGKPCLVGFFTDVTQRRQAEESLKKAHRQLMYAGEQERHSLAKDLHDSLGQQAVAMHLAVESLLTRAKRADDAYVQELARLSQVCQSLTEDIRNACYGLYPPTLETLGLCSALRQLLRDNEQIIKVKMACCQKCEDVRLAPDIEIALFRIAQEAVSNVLRHGKAKHMELSLDMDDTDVVLTVSDDGVDFDVEKTETGLGLLSMRERASAVGGSLEISSKPERTSVVARIPVVDED